jgi:hypothetical protein
MNTSTCKNCKKENTLRIDTKECYLVCTECGFVNDNNNICFDLSDYETYKDYDTRIMKKNFYRRKDYFDNIFRKIEGKSRAITTTNILNFVKKKLPNIPKIEKLSDYIIYSNKIQKILNKSKYKKHKHKSKLILQTILKFKINIPDQLKKDLSQLYYNISYKFSPDENKKKICNLNMLFRELLNKLSNLEYDEEHKSTDFIELFPIPKCQVTIEKNKKIIEKLLDDKNLFLNRNNKYIKL